jgi:two-component sensor histidine kinase
LIQVICRIKLPWHLWQSNIVRAVQMSNPTRDQILYAFVEQFPESITVAVGPHVQIVAVSKYGRTLLQRAQDELTIPLGLHTENWRIERPDGTKPKDSELPLTRATLDGETVLAEEFCVYTNDGQKKVILCNAGPIRDDEGNITEGVIAWRDITELRETQARLAKALEEKTLLLRELNHRAMNSLAVLKALVDIQRRRLPEQARAFETISIRIAALAALYRHLHQQGENVEEVDLETFIGAVCADLRESILDSERGDSLVVDIQQHTVPQDEAIAVALVLAELVTNSSIHAYDADQPRHITVVFVADGHCELTICDDGRGFPEGFDPQASTGLGLKVVMTMASKLGGSASFTSIGTKSISQIVWPRSAR